MDTDSSRISGSSRGVLTLFLAHHSPEEWRKKSITDELEPNGSKEAKVAEFVGAAESCRPQLLRLAARVVGNCEEADDIVQEALLKAFANLSKFRGESRVSTWLCAIVRNTAFESVRKQRGRVFVPLECPLFPKRSGEHPDLPDVRLNPEECYEHLEREEMVSAAVGRISPAYRRVFEMCVLEERPYVQVATLFNIPLSTLKSRLFRSRRDLRKEISKSKQRIHDPLLPGEKEDIRKGSNCDGP